jgi:bifunctional N-acetylglucosamine-1-phosphate-uridyltransferase/glucosamine-1-phosphate-acetyltransferase GlmU-like protein
MAGWGFELDNYVTKNSGITNVVHGKNVIIINPSNLYGCSLGDGVFVGPFVEIQKGVSIGKNTRLKRHRYGYKTQKK